MNHRMLRKRKILITVHVLTYTGASIFALYVANILMQNGYDVYVFAYEDGNLKEAFKKNNINVVVLDNKAVEIGLYELIDKDFDLLIAFTVLTYQVVELMNYKIPIVWYIHESKAMLSLVDSKHIKDVLGLYNEVWCVSEYSANIMQQYYNRKPQILHNFVPDEKKEESKRKDEDNKIKFLFVGRISEDKAPRDLIDAVQELTEDYRVQCECVFVGKADETEYSINTINLIQVMNNMRYYGPVEDRDRLMKIYNNSDIIVVPSLDESCSLVVLEAMMMGKSVIASKNVGAKYMISESTGWLFETGDIKELSSILKAVIDSKAMLTKMGECARTSYLLNASENVFKRELLEKIEKIIPRNRNVWKTLQYPKFLLWNIYRKYYYNPFGGISIPKGSRIVIYGAGTNGKKWYLYLQSSKYCELVAWIDKYKYDEKKIFSLSKLKLLQYDFILITVANREIQKEIKKELEMINVEEDKIIFLNT